MIQQQVDTVNVVNKYLGVTVGRPLEATTELELLEVKKEMLTGKLCRIN